MKIEYFNGNVVQILHDFAALLLQYTGAIALLFLVATGVYYIMSEGDPERQKRASKSLSYIIMGLIIIAFSYSVLVVVAKLAN